MKILEYFKPVKADNDFNLLPDGIFTLEQDGKIIDVNDKVLKMYNATRFDFLGRYFSDCVENGTAILNQVIKNNEYVCARAKVKDTESPMILEINTIRNDDTQKVYVSARDVTGRQREQKSITEKYTMAQKIIDEKNDFLLTSSGALLSSLVSISGFSRALLDGIGGALSEKQEKYLNIINTNSKDLSYDLEKLFTLFMVESKKHDYNCKNFDFISLIKSIKRVYEKDIKDKKIIFNLDYSHLTQRDCTLDPEIIEYILRCIMEIFVRFSNLGKCSLNIGHPPVDFLKTRDFRANISPDPEKYILIEAKITDLVFNQDELDNIFDTYYKGSNKRPIGLKASLNLLKYYITDFGGDIWVYSKQSFGTMFTFVLPLK
ncbi:MAG: PAS domain-containing sensor histidine kinase [Candidatus Gastranaerophilales bacterium]|nr:PAS domain-containing sensor histidine kinase [Candidatus Gastranaerophilales bacterium]